MKHDWTYDEWTDDDGTYRCTDLYCAVCYFEWDPRLSEDELPPCPVEP